ncbi:MAG: glycosyltransferase, partial [Alphaproteobacteria bacterium]|nr:glycosyltransferase [Alphaproteobacteria bacterium]
PVIARRLGPFPEIVEAAEGGVLFETESELLDALRTIQTDQGWRDRHGDQARRAFETFWSEDQVLAAYGAELARAAHRKGDVSLARLLEAGAF